MDRFSKTVLRKMKKVLVVTYYWPPSGGPGVQRVLKFCKYLPEFGWEPIVLTVQDGEYPAIDKSLLEESDGIETYLSDSISFYSIFNKLSGSKTVPTHQLSKSKSDSFFTKFARWVRYNLIIPDGRIGWVPGAVRKGKEILKDQNIDLIFTSGPPHSVHLIGKKLSKATGVKWVTDFRDPWTDRFYYYENPRNKITTWIDGQIEKSVLKQCHGLSTVSPGFQTLLNNRHPIEQKSSIITNGFDENDFSGLIPNENSNEKIIISHTGSLSRSQNPTGLLKSIQSYNRSNSNKKLFLQLVGSVHPDILEFIENLEIANYVKIIAYKPHRESIQVLLDSDFIFLVVPNMEKSRGIIPGKLFEYIRSETEIILLGKESDAAAIAEELGYENIFNIQDQIDFNQLMINSNNHLKKPTNFDRKNLTKKLSDLFNQIHEKKE